MRRRDNKFEVLLAENDQFMDNDLTMELFHEHTVYPEIDHFPMV